MVSKTKQPFLSVVIPAYNEAANFRSGCLNSAVEYLSKQEYTWELLFVDDGSTDETNKLLTKYCATDSRFNLLRIIHGGKAAAVTAGMLHAKGKNILFTDFDQSTPISQVSKFISAHDNGADVVIGVRGGEGKARHESLFTRIRSLAFLTIVQVVALPGIKDTQCGFKSFTNEASQQIFSKLLVSLPKGKVMGGYMGAFDIEILFLSRKLGFRIDQLPVDWVRQPSNRLNIWKEPLMMIRDTLKVRLYDILGKYDAILAQ